MKQTLGAKSNVESLWSVAILVLTNAKTVKARYSMETVTKNAAKSTFVVMIALTSNVVLRVHLATKHVKLSVNILSALKNVEILAKSVLSHVHMVVFIQNVQNCAMKYVIEILVSTHVL